MSGLTQHLLLPSFLLLLPFFLVLILTPTGETVKCYECVWYEGNESLKLDLSKDRFCTHEFFNNCRASAKNYHDGHLCVTFVPNKEEMDGIVLMGLLPTNVDFKRKCKKEKSKIEEMSITVNGKTIVGRGCSCKEDFCNYPVAAGSSPTLALVPLLVSGLVQKLI